MLFSETLSFFIQNFNFSLEASNFLDTSTSIIFGPCKDWVIFSWENISEKYATTNNRFDQLIFLPSYASSASKILSLPSAE